MLVEQRWMELNVSGGGGAPRCKLELSAGPMYANTGKRFRRLWFDASVQYGALSGANFATSPLVRRDSDSSVGFGFAWLIGKSSPMVEVNR